MAIYVFGALANGALLSFDPESDVLQFGSIGTSASEIALTQSGGDVVVAAEGKTITLQATLLAELGGANVTFADGSALFMGGAGDDSLAGGAGGDYLDGLSGGDVMTGGAGDDTYVVDSELDAIVELAGGGTDTVRSSITWLLGANLEDLVLLGAVDLDGFGNGLDNRITGNGGANFLFGGVGNDTLDGGAGDDILFGQSGNDVFRVDSQSDQTVELAAQGVDRVESLVDWVLGANIENLVLLGAADIGGAGNDLANLIIGNAGANLLEGGPGDTLQGGGGNDIYAIDSTGVTVLEALDAGIDELRSSIDYALDLNVERLVLTGSASIDGTGNSLANLITGNAGANFLSGGSGADTLAGGDGDDVLAWDAQDVSDGGADFDTLAVPGEGVALDLAELVFMHESIEMVDLSGTGANSIVFDAASIAQWSAVNGVLRVRGGFDDAVEATGEWTLSGHEFVDGEGFTRYVQGEAEVLVSDTVRQSGMHAASLDLAGLDGHHGFSLLGQAAVDFFGASVSGAGDVNGDGYDDFLIGADGVDVNGSFSGLTYVVFGSGDAFPASVDVAALDGTNGFAIAGVAADDQSGRTVGNAGDVNGDGFGDLLVGAWYADPAGRADAGANYVVFGKAGGFAAQIELAALNGSNGFRLAGVAPGDQSGRTASAAGDVNGDGYGDLIVGAYRGESNGTNSGAGYVVFGKSGGFAPSLDLAALDGANGFVLAGAEGQQVGTSVSEAGDVNGDGFGDMIVGAPGYAALVFGGYDVFGASVDLAALDGSNGFRLEDSLAPGSFQRQVSGAGDVNGDGLDDLIVGNPDADPGGRAGAGTSYVVFGKSGGFAASVDLDALDGSDGFRLLGVAAADASGRAVSGAGDVNGDGYDDLIVGAWVADAGGLSNAGEAYVFFGKAGGVDADVELDTLDGVSGFRVPGALAGDRAGVSVSTAGDVDGDGYGDLIVGASDADPNGSLSGASYVLFGRDFTDAVTHFSGSVGELVAGTSAAEIFVAGLGDDSLTGGGGADVFHAGGGDDLIVVPDLMFRVVDGGSGDDTLAIAVEGLELDLADVRGRLSGIESIDLTGSGNSSLVLTPLDLLSLASTTNTIRVRGDAEDEVGSTVPWTFAGVVEADGTTYAEYRSGAARLLAEAELDRGGLQVNNYLLAGSGDAHIFRLAGALAGDHSGRSVSAAGDVNGDGFGDLIVGAPSTDLNGDYTGASYVVFGKSGGFAVDINVSTLDGTNGFRLAGVLAYDNAGYSVSAAGDVNGDGYSDLILGAPFADPNGLSSGASYVVFGKSGGFAANINLSTLDGTSGFRLAGTLAGDLSGRSVSAAGDVNGDGYGDLIVGASGVDLGGPSYGACYVVFGKNGAFAPSLELATLDGANGFVLVGAAGQQVGTSVSAAGDVNGDGFGDLIVGAPRANPNGDYTGATYIVFGKSEGFAADFSVSTLDGTNGFRLAGTLLVDRSGYSVSAAGDVNGDGYGDLILGAPFADPNGLSSGASYVVFGKSGGFAASINLSTLDGTNGFRLAGAADYDYASRSVSAAGDVNGDGYGDLIVGAHSADPNGLSSGASYVVFGKSGGFAANINLSTLDGTSGFRLAGGLAGDQSGRSVSEAGDVNGDGFGDLIVGADAADPNGSGSGASYVFFGRDFRGEVEYLGTEDDDVLVGAPGDDSILIGGQGEDSLDGGSDEDVLKGGAGNDTLIGGTGHDYLEGGSGDDVYHVDDLGDRVIEEATLGHDVVYSSVSFSLLSVYTAEVEDVVLTGIANVNATGNTAANLLAGNAGNNVLAGLAGDDTLVGGGNDTIAGGAGIDTLRLSGSGQLLDLMTVPNANITDIEVVDVTGVGNNSLYLNAAEILAISSTTDVLRVEGDVGDVVLADGFWSYAGRIEIGPQTYAQYKQGGATLQADIDMDLSGIGIVFDASQLDGVIGMSFAGASAEQAGVAVAGADVNGDGFADLVIGAPSADSPFGGLTDAGAAYVVFGGDGATLDLLHGGSGFALSGLNGTNGIALLGIAAGDYAGSSVAAGDVDGDGAPDILVGANRVDVPPSTPDAGAAYIVFGAGTETLEVMHGSEGFDLDDLDGDNGFRMRGEAVQDFAGAAIAHVGDVNGDGFGDIVVGAPGSNDGGSDAGTSYVVFGGGSEFVVDLGALDGTDGFALIGPQPFFNIGRSVSAAGDMNGDGFGDILVGSGGSHAYVVFGKASFAGTPAVQLGALDGSDGIAIGSGNAYESVGLAVSAAGDVNGDGFDDVAVGAPGPSIVNYYGNAYVVFGGDAGYLDALHGATGLTAAALDGANGFRVRGTQFYGGTGSVLAGGGDVNGDGFDDLVIGSGGYNNNYILFGRTSPHAADVFPDSLPTDEAVRINGNVGAAAIAGDVNGDGYDDVMVGTLVPSNAGAVHVFFGGDFHAAAEISGTAGDDVLLPSLAERPVVAGNGNDTILGAAADDTLKGGAGNDFVDGGEGADWLHGGTGDDIYAFDNAGDRLVEEANAGNDTLRTFVNVELADNQHIETIELLIGVGLSATGNRWANSIFGSTGADTLDGGGGDDLLAGGAGDDIYVVDSLLDLVTEQADQGLADEIRTALEYTLPDHVERLLLSGAAAVNGTGNALANALTGNGAANALAGGAGNDTLAGAAGTDTLDGGIGADSMAGGTQNDTYVVDDAGDVVTELASGGANDLVQSSISYVLGAELERLTLTGLSAINGTGNGLNNQLVGNNAANVLDGGTGNDSMFGWEGDDTYVVDSVGDMVAEGNPPGGVDTVLASVGFSLASIGNVEHVTLTGAAAIDATGNNLANLLTGNGAANLLSGANGADTLVGNAGADTLDGGAAADSMAGGADSDIYEVDNPGDAVSEAGGAANGTADEVHASINYTLTLNVERLVLGGVAGFSGTGNGLANHITGNGANNGLTGGSGNDTLVGGGGNDKLTGNLGTDSMIGGAGDDTYNLDSAAEAVLELQDEGFDTVNAGFSYTLPEHVERLVLTGGGDIDGTGNAQDNSLQGSTGANLLQGGEGADALFGRPGNDTLNGGAGNDGLRGGGGNDVLTGGEGADSFFFLELPVAGHADLVTDFASGTDKLRLDDAMLVAIGAPGAFAAGDARFASGAGMVAAADADDRIVYDTSTGSFYYDADGVGGTLAGIIGTLQGAPVLAAEDIIVF